MSLKDYANTSLNSAINDAAQWRMRADTAIADFQNDFMQRIKGMVDWHNAHEPAGKNGKHRLTTENPSNYTNSIPLIGIRYNRNDPYHTNRPYYQTSLDTSHDTYDSYVIWVNNEAEAEYCKEQIIRFLQNEGLTIIKIRSRDSGIIFKSKEGGYIIRYYLEW